MNVAYCVAFSVDCLIMPFGIILLIIDIFLKITVISYNHRFQFILTLYMKDGNLLSVKLSGRGTFPSTHLGCFDWSNS